MLQVILIRLKAKAEELLAEEQAGFRRGRSAIGQILNVRMVIQKHLQHQRDSVPQLLRLQKECDRVRHAGLWQVLRSFNIDEGLVLEFSGTI